jgi:creatinine amidohydrolase
VCMQRAQNFSSTSAERAAHFPILGNGTSAKLGWQTQDYNPLGACGDAAAATPAKGRAVLDAAGEQLAQMLHEFAQLPLTTLRDTHGL